MTTKKKTVSEKEQRPREFNSRTDFLAQVQHSFIMNIGSSSSIFTTAQALHALMKDEDLTGLGTWGYKVAGFTIYTEQDNPRSFIHVTSTVPGSKPKDLSFRELLESLTWHELVIAHSWLKQCKYFLRGYINRLEEEVIEEE